MSEWLPIETAPRDGTRIITWSDEVGEVCFSEFSVHDGAGCWFTTDQQTGDAWRHKPTYWMPVPLPPKGVA
jgi:hypothetical protein